MVDLGCFISYFTEDASQCRILNLNRDFWINSTTELLIGGLVLVGLLGVFQNYRINKLWTCARESRANMLADDFAALLKSVYYAVVGFQNHLSGNPSSLQFMRDEIAQAHEALGDMRNWIGSSATIYPTKSLQSLSEIERTYVRLNRMTRVFLSDLDYWRGALDGDPAIRGEHGVDGALVFEKCAYLAHCIDAFDAAARRAFGGLSDPDLVKTFAAAGEMQGKARGMLEELAGDLREAFPPPPPETTAQHAAARGLRRRKAATSLAPSGFRTFLAECETREARVMAAAGPRAETPAAPH